MTEKLTSHLRAPEHRCELCSRCLLHLPLRRTVVSVHTHVTYDTSAR